MESTPTQAGRLSSGDRSMPVEVAGKYMTFKLATEEYGVEILHVREIIGLMDITHVPRTAPHIRGVLNLRGKVIPVVDLRLKFGMERIEPTEHTVIIVVQHQLGDCSVTTGLLVDEVLEVLNVEEGMLEPPPTFGGKESDADFLVGVGKVGKRMVFLLDIERVLQNAQPAQAVA